MISFFNTLVADIQIQHPVWIWLWFLSISVVGTIIYVGGISSLSTMPAIAGKQHYRHPRLELLRKIYQQRIDVTLKRNMLKRWLSYAVFFLGIHLALSQPYYPGRQLPTPPEYRDTIFMVDTSISMVLRDYLVGEKRVDRMTMMKSVLGLFIDQLNGNRIGLIAYSEEAYTLAPLTSDYPLLKSMMRRLEPAVLTGRTSNPGKAMLYAMQKIDADSEQDTEHKPVLVLVTDVNRPDRTLDPRVIAEHISNRGYRLHVIGIGAASYDAKESKYSGLIFHPANIKLLKSIADKGRGQFYWADNARNLQDAMKAIQSAEKRKVDVTPQYIKLPLYHWPILASLIWIITLQLWPIKGRHS